MDIFYNVIVLLVLSRLGGEIAERLGQPALAGELIAGVVLGIVVNLQAGAFPVLAEVSEYEGFMVLADFGMFFLMLAGGVELRPSKLLDSSKGALLIAIGGLLLPFGLGFAATYAIAPESPLLLAQSLFVGTALAITAVPVSIKVLMELRQLDSPVGTAIVSAALIDDILSLLLLALLTGLVRTGQAPTIMDLAWLLGRAVAFLVLAAVVAQVLLPRLYSWVLGRTHVDEFEFSLLLIVALGFAIAAEAFGLHFVLGPFLAGLFFGRRTVDKEIVESVQVRLNAVTSGFLAPLFFVSIGLHADVSAVTKSPGFFILLLGIAFFTKIVGSAGPAKICGFSNRHALAIGVGMSGRGAVELIIAQVALDAGVFESDSSLVQNMYGTIVLVAALTTIATPILLRRLLAEEKDAAEKSPS